jgi:hypothetical protein
MHCSIEYCSCAQIELKRVRKDLTAAEQIEEIRKIEEATVTRKQAFVSRRDN